MDLADHTCDGCSQWDDVNGCWRTGRFTRFGGAEMACPDFDGDDFDEPDDDRGPTYDQEEDQEAEPEPEP